MNAGFLALSTDHWPDLLARWWELCERVPREQYFGRFEQPFWAGDQDVLNAILASEIPEEAIAELPADGEAYPEELLEAVVVDERTLRCELRGQPICDPPLLARPEGLAAQGLVRLRDDAYVRLLPRLLFGDDVAVRLEPKSGSALASARRSGAGSRPRRRPGARRRPRCRARPARSGSRPGACATKRGLPPALGARLRAAGPPRSLISAKGRPERSAIAFRSWRPSERFSTQSSAPSANEPPPTARYRPRFPSCGSPFGLRLT